MHETLSNWIGDIHLALPPYWSGVVATFAAVVCGGLIGLERARAQKPVGPRTLILICLGSAIFTQASILMAGTSADRTRIAAQVVSGIGFLGAGAIIHEGGLIIGVTTGAAIWATAAVGMVLGGGYVAAGFVFTAIILLTLGTARLLDRWIEGPCRFRTLRLSYAADGGKTRLAIQAILDEHLHEAVAEFTPPPPAAGGTPLDGLAISYCEAHRSHRLYLRELIALPQVTSAQFD